MMDPNPLVSILIPTKNRADLLLRALSSVERQTVAVEVIVLDDGSTDGSEAMVRDRFPQVVYMNAPESRGPTWQRNRGAAIARTRFLVTLDDDCEFVSDDTLAEALADFDHPRVAAVTLPFINIHQDREVRSQAPGPGVHVTVNYFGGMVVLRRDAFLSVGGYRSEYFMQGEETDFAARLLHAGYVVRLGRSSAIHHHESPSRNRPRLHVLGARNAVFFAWLNVPQPYLVPHLVGTTLQNALFGVRSDHPASVFSGLAQGLTSSLLRLSRTPLSRRTYRLIRMLKRCGSSPLADIEHLLPALPDASRSS